MSTNLNEQILPLLDEHGRKWTTISRLLNEAGSKTQTGNPWDANNLRRYVNDHLPDRKSKDTGARVTQARTLEVPHGADQPDPREEITKLLHEAYQDGTLPSLIEWWRDRGGAPLPTVEQRPIFRGTRRNTGVHVNQILLERALERVKQDKAGTGGSLSRLVELLLWRYLGEPADVIETAPSAANTAD